ncbi:kinase phosphorylation protein-domain-containing protein [Dichomitus squalens]|uniref:Kinase phosphorylation protein-domain-containing protein n=1 Tax=Dichomitus squalens TaxID=114155 RepID=A0A4Q9P921_9APHY|nr:uncharacterized protein DICSQDRAFT_51475 [Dichomitus squalens LYAD-421 SS1]EJF65214.1 hypothetical protein DICSQDRAFT_51475 [Dichomitus squalens LYAD-421 SS1]TBU48646.1 kinase phosphorylation protein-domain-containing protein [Dichomitus squalens]TBU59705.1 kinase phosphorylation protein-domain-containing protein [Dichomitus squalens]
MFEPVRGGTRGGQAEFKWSDVSQDKDRENYLGHSINAPTGRWQKNKDVHWYQREKAQTDAERREELRKIKEAEEEALAAALCVLSPTASRRLLTRMLQWFCAWSEAGPCWGRRHGGECHCRPSQVFVHRRVT